MRWNTATWQSKAMTCAYCHKAIQANEQYRFSKIDKVHLHKTCYEVS